MEYIILIAIAYLIYRTETKTTETKTEMFLRNNCLSDEKPKERKKTLRTKEDFIEHIENDYASMKKFLGHDDFIEENHIEKIRNIKKVFDEPNSKENLIFHGGCLGCKSQEQNGIGRCKGCKYFIADWSLPDLSKSPFYL